MLQQRNLLTQMGPLLAAAALKALDCVSPRAARQFLHLHDMRQIHGRATSAIARVLLGASTLCPQKPALPVYKERSVSSVTNAKESKMRHIFVEHGRKPMLAAHPVTRRIPDACSKISLQVRQVMRHPAMSHSTCT